MANFRHSAEYASLFRLYTNAPYRAEAWLHTADMAAQLRRADDWYKEHPLAETNLDALAQQLEIDA